MSSSQLEHLISIRLSKIQKIPYEFIGSRTKDKDLVVRGTALGEVIESEPCEWHRSSGELEGVWQRKRGELIWKLNSRQLQEAKSKKPKIKLQCLLIKHTNTNDSMVSEVGVVMLDIRDLQVTSTAQQKAHTLSGGRRTELVLTAKLTTALPSMEANHSQSSGGRPQLSTSLSSDASVLKIGDSQQNRRIALSITLVSGSELESVSPNFGDDVWLSYILFNEVIQTDKFKLRDRLVPPRRDVFALESNATFLAEWLHNNSPLKLFLCAENKILAKGTIPLTEIAALGEWNQETTRTFECILTPRVASSIQHDIQAVVTIEVHISYEAATTTTTAGGTHKRKDTKISNTTQNGTADGVSKVRKRPPLAPQRPLRTRQLDVTLVRLQLDPIDHYEQDVAICAEGFYTCIQLNNDTVYGVKGDRTPFQCGEYGEFELEEPVYHQSSMLDCADPILDVTVECVSAVSRTVLASGKCSIDLTTNTSICGPESQLHPTSFPIKLYQHPREVGNAVVELVPAAAGRNTAENGTNRQLEQQQQQPQQLPTSMANSINIITADDDIPHQFRLAIDVKSIRKMTRAGNFSVTYSYPYLGNGNPVRSSHVWVQRNTEVAVEKAGATYSITTEPIALQKILVENPLQIDMRARDQITTVDAGYATVDLGVLYRNSTMMFRCPVTKKNFYTLQDYEVHTHMAAALHPEEKEALRRPVILRIFDAYIPVADALVKSGTDMIGSIRVFIVLEDLGPDSRAQRQSNAAGVALPLPPPAAASTTFPLYGGKIEDQNSTVAAMPAPQETAAQLKIQDLQRQQEMAQAEAARMKEEMARMAVVSEEARAAEAQRLSQLQKAQHDYERLECKLRQALEETERRQLELKLAEESLNMKHAQKMAEVQLLQKRVREEAKVKIDAERTKTVALEERIVGLQEDVKRTEKRYMDVVEEFERFRHSLRSQPEQKLREENAQLRAQLVEMQTKVDKEQDEKRKAEQEREQYRGQLQRLAMALKLQREKALIANRQEMEQLRLEYRAREERYVLDGDRGELKAIRADLERLRMDVCGDQSPDNRISTNGGGGGPAAGSDSVSSQQNTQRFHTS